MADVFFSQMLISNSLTQGPLILHKHFIISEDQEQLTKRRNSVKGWCGCKGGPYLAGMKMVSHTGPL